MADKTFSNFVNGATSVTPLNTDLMAVVRDGASKQAVISSVGIGSTINPGSDLQAEYDALLLAADENATLHATSGDYSVSGTLNTALSAGAITEIKVNITTTETISATGTVTLWNSSKDTEDVAYTAVGNVGEVYTFTVSDTISNSYAVDDVVFTDTDRTITVNASDDRVNIVSVGSVSGLTVA
ncbi:MAG: hypothetical protein GY845_25660 [Planctomycetes bacterium]|nr:hypothetical protein [Planctomycetota bacterium]